MKNKILIPAIFIISSIYALSVDTRYWMEPVLCVPDLTFRHVLIMSGLFMFSSYLIFSYQLLYRLGAYLKTITCDEFPVTLSLVFMLCGLCYLLHSLSYFDQSIKPFLIPVYSLLIYFHVKLILISKQAFENLLSLKTKEDYDHIVDRNEELEDLLHWVNRQAELTSLKFQSDEVSDVTMEDMLGYKQGHRYDLGFGVSIYVNTVSDDNYEIVCWMVPYMEDGELKPAIVKKHIHSNIREVFKMEEGTMTDEYNNVSLLKDDEYTYEPNIIHEPMTYVANRMIITGERC